MAFSLSSCFNLLFVCLVQVFECFRLCGCKILTFYKNLHSILQFALHFLFVCSVVINRFLSHLISLMLTLLTSPNKCSIGWVILQSIHFFKH
jgi:hypothetical protein